MEFIDIRLYMYVTKYVKNKVKDKDFIPHLASGSIPVAT